MASMLTALIALSMLAIAACAPTPSQSPSTATPAATPAPGSLVSESSSASAAAAKPDGGPVPVSDAEGVIRSTIHPGAKRCYQRALEKDHTLVGRVVILIRLDADGVVTEATVSSLVGLTQAMADCIADVARTAHFPPPGAGGASISVPVNFRHAEAPAAP
jgi:hypothetical protein